jgi:hypothetical protein
MDLIWICTLRNGAIREVVQIGFEQQEEIGQSTRVHRKNEVVDKP